MAALPAAPAPASPPRARLRSVRRAGLALVLAVFALAALTPAASALPGLTLGFASFPAPGSPASALYLRRAVAEGASIVRVDAAWSTIAPARQPRGFEAANPASPGYQWGALDAQVESLTAAGLRVLLTVTSAPRWAEGPHMPRHAPPGTWRPSPSALAAFATALALRYDGHYPDPAHPGRTLPRVTLWQAWNEPNLNVYISPQWTRTAHGFAPASPGIYRALADAFYRAVKRVSPANFVILAGTAPYGDPPGGLRMPPVQFDRYLFCLRGRQALTPVRCPAPTYFDAIDHHPYGIAGPLQHALNPDDAAIPDIYKITRVLHAAERAGRALPRGPKQVWVTEVSWNTRPPNPGGVPVRLDARWLEQALYVLWRQGVDTVLWLQIVDSPPIPSYNTTYQAGLYYLDGRPKPAARAYRFPFVTQRLRDGRVLVWGRAPAAGRLLIQRRIGRRWVTLRRLEVRTHQVFEARLSLAGAALLRARLGAQLSLPWSQPR